MYTLKFAIYFLFFFTFIVSSQTLKLNGVPSDYPKCCGYEEIFGVNETGFVCVEDKNKTSYLIVNDNKNNWYETCFGNESCIELFKEEVIKVNCKRRLNRNPNGSKLNSTGNKFNTTENKVNPIFEKYNLRPGFHKCCPPNHAYNTKEHKCLKESNSGIFRDLYNGTHFIHVSLESCELPVKDYFVGPNDLPQPINGDLIFQSERLSFSNYCIDKIGRTLDKYVLRICHKNYDVCKTKYGEEDRIKCIRKCCPDGMMHANSSRCVTTYDHGLEFGNLHQVHSPNGKNNYIFLIYSHSLKKAKT